MSLEHQLGLQEKFNAYLRFVESGELAEEFPNLSGLPVVFDVRFMHQPDAEGLIFLEKASKVIEAAGFSLSFGVGPKR